MKKSLEKSVKKYFRKSLERLEKYLSQGLQLRFVLIVPSQIEFDLSQNVNSYVFAFGHSDMGLGFLQHFLSNPYSRGAQINV